MNDLKLRHPFNKYWSLSTVPSAALGPGNPAGKRWAWGLFGEQAVLWAPDFACM